MFNYQLSIRKVKQGIAVCRQSLHVKTQIDGSEFVPGHKSLCEQTCVDDADSLCNAKAKIVRAHKKSLRMLHMQNTNCSERSERVSGFTLVEMLVSMAIFMMFTGILISSYTGILRAQRDANSYREMYVQARQVMETLVQELRDGMVDYGNGAVSRVINGEITSIALDPADHLYLVSRDGATKTKVTYEKDKDSIQSIVRLSKTHLSKDKMPSKELGDYALLSSVDLNDPANVKVSKFRLYFSPKIDPYDTKSVDYSTSQFQPRVTIYAEFTKKLVGSDKTYKMDLQTTVSSRVYSQVYPTDYLYTNIR